MTMPVPAPAGTSSGMPYKSRRTRSWVTETTPPLASLTRSDTSYRSSDGNSGDGGNTTGAVVEVGSIGTAVVVAFSVSVPLQLLAKNQQHHNGQKEFPSHPSTSVCRPRPRGERTGPRDSGSMTFSFRR